MGAREDTLAELVRAILAVDRPHPVRVAVDGCTAAGKTTLADELAAVLRVHTRRKVIRAGIDYFKKHLDLRTAYPRDSPESYYLDYWDYPAVLEQLLIPLGPGGDRRYRTAVMDLPGRTAIAGPVEVATGDAVLIADGAFLLRPELDAHWDLRIFVDVSFAEVFRRGVARDRVFLGPAAEARYRGKYIPGEQRYLDEVRPQDHADLVVGNENPAAPVLSWRSR